MSVKDIDLGWGKIVAQMQELDATSVKVGVQDNAGMVEGGNIAMAKLAAVHEFGGEIKVAAGSVTQYRKVKKSGDFANSGRLTSKNKSNFAQTMDRKAHSFTMPQRSFIRSAVDENKKKIDDMSAKLAGKIVDGMSPNQALGIMGNAVQGMIQKKIANGPFEPNKPSTVKKKGRNKPLIDTGHLRQSIRYVVE